MTSKSDKTTKQFQKLTNAIMQAQNYLELQNAIDQFNSIKKSLFTQQQSEHKQSKHSQTNNLLNTTEELIKQKIKYFKKKALDKLNSPNNYLKQQNNSSITKIKYDRYSPMEEDHNKYNSKPNMTVQKQSNHKKSKKDKEKEKENFKLYRQDDDFIQSQRKSKIKKLQQPDNSFRRLKQSKSVQNLFAKKNSGQSFTLRGEQTFSNKKRELDQSQRQYNKDSHFEKYNNKRMGEKDDRSFIDFDDEKTQVRMRQQSIIENNQTQNLLKMMEWLQHKNDGEIGMTEIKRKLGEKVLELQEMRGKLKYYENENSQLKKRIHNEQRRQQDYIVSLKGRLKGMDDQLYQNDKEKKMMAQLIQEMEFKMKTQEKQIATYGQQLQQALHAKQLSQSQSVTQTLNLKKELQLLSKHQSSLQDLQALLTEQKTNNSILSEKNQVQTKQLKQLNEHLTILTNDKSQLQELLEIKLQEIQSYQQEIYQLKKQLQQEHEQNSNLQNQLQGFQQREKQLERRKENNLKKKMQKLKSVKSLLEQQV